MGRFQSKVFVLIPTLFQLLTSLDGFTLTRSPWNTDATIEADIDVNFENEYNNDDIGFCQNDSPTTIRLCLPYQVRYVELDCQPPTGGERVKAYVGAVFNSSLNQWKYAKLYEGNNDEDRTYKKAKFTRDVLEQASPPCFYCWSHDKDYQVIKRSEAFKFTFDFDCSSPPIERVQEAPAYGKPTTVSCWNTTITERHTVQWAFKALDSTVFLPLDTNATSITTSSLTQDEVGTYKCIVWFEESFVRYETRIHLSSTTDGPPAPIEPKLLYLNDTMVKITWTKPSFRPIMLSDDMGPVQIEALRETQYTADLYELNGVGEWILRVESASSKQMCIRGECPNFYLHVGKDTVPRVEFAGLRPLTVYKIEIRTVHKQFGTSKPLIKYFSTRGSGYFSSGLVHISKKNDAVIWRLEGELSALNCSIYDNVSHVSWRYFPNVTTVERIMVDWKPLESTSFPVTEANVGQYMCHSDDSWGYLLFDLGMLKRPLKPDGCKCSMTEGRNAKIDWLKPSAEDESSLVSRRVEKYKWLFRKVGSHEDWRVDERRADQTWNALPREDGVLVAYRLVASNRAGDSEACTCVL